MLDFEWPTVGDVPLLFTLLALELVLSFDNAAILAALANRLPPEQRRKALLYGLVGAYFFRVLAIVFVFVILANEWLKLVGAAYLIWLMVKHLIDRNHPHAHKGPTVRRILGLSALWSTILYIEAADIAFALDQILVAVALTDKISIIIIASLIAIIFLRVAAYYISRIMGWFPPLETLAYLAVGFVGFKMVLAFHFPFAPWLHYEIPGAVSIAVTFSLIILPPLGKYLYEVLTGKRGGQKPEPDAGPATEGGASLAGGDASAPSSGSTEMDPRPKAAPVPVDE